MGVTGTGTGWPTRSVSEKSQGDRSQMYGLRGVGRTLCCIVSTAGSQEEEDFRHGVGGGQDLISLKQHKAKHNTNKEENIAAF